MIKNIVLKWIVVYCLIFLIALSMYYTIYLPLRKNMLIMNAVGVNGKTPKQALDNFEIALKFYSPVGQIELDQQLFTFSKDFINWLKTENIDALEQKRNVEIVSKLTSNWFEKDRSQFAGVKNSYIFLEMMIEAYKITNDKELLEKTKKLLDEEIKLSPTRIELLLQQLSIAEVEKDDALVKQIKAKIEKIRPDLKE